MSIDKMLSCLNTPSPPRVLFLHFCEFSFYMEHFCKYWASFLTLFVWFIKNSLLFSRHRDDDVSLGILDFTILDVAGLQLHHMSTSSLIVPTACHMNSNRHPEVPTDYMDAQRSTRLSATAIQQSLHGPSACHPTALLLDRSGTRVLGRLQPQTGPQAACILNRTASELSGGISADEALEGTSASRPCSAPWSSRKFWGAGDYDAVVGGAEPQPQSMSQCKFFMWILLILCSIPLGLMLITLLCLQVCRIACAPILNFSTPTRLLINGHLGVSFCVVSDFFFLIMVLMFFFEESGGQEAPVG